MKEYTYYFVDGTKNTILIEDEWYDILTQMDEDERKQNYNHGRHNTPLSAFDYDGEAFADPSGDIFDELMRKAEREKFDAALDTLTECQRKLFEAVYYEKKKVIDIAAEQGVSHQAITHRLARIKANLQKLLV